MKPGPAEAGVVLVPPTELSMDLGVEVVITVLLGILALSAPSVLSLALFRVLVKEGTPLDSQEFRRKHSGGSVVWLMMFLPGLFAIFTIGNPAMPDKLRAASIMCASTLIIVLSWFFLILILRSKLRVKRPDFIKASPLHVFDLIYLSWSMLFLYHFRKHFEWVFG